MTTATIMARTGLIALLLGLSIIAKAQPKGLSIWFTAQLPVDFSKRIQWHNDLSFKSNGMELQPYQRFYRTGLRYRFTEHFNAAAGIGFFTTQTSSKSEDDEFGREFRIWQEFIFQTDMKRDWSFQNRLRTEERFLEATNTKPATSIININDKISFTKALSDKWDIQFSDEFFEQLVDKRFVYNQNRLMGTGIYNITSKLQVQAAYSWVVRSTFSQHILQFTIRKIFSVYGRHDHSSE